MILAYMQTIQSSEDTHFLLHFDELCRSYRQSGTPAFGIESIPKGCMFEASVDVQMVSRPEVPALVSSSRDFPVFLSTCS